MGGQLRWVFGVLLCVYFLTPQQSANARQSNQCANLFQDDSQTLKIGTYNLLNLFIHVGNDKNSVAAKKPEWATIGLADVIKQEKYDILVAQEVESIDSAQRFNREYLENKYYLFSTKTNDRRGLYIVFFVKKNLNYNFKLESHLEEKWYDPLKEKMLPLFERDLPTLHVFDKNSSRKPILTILGAHFKSKRHRFKSGTDKFDFIQGLEVARENIDYESNMIRTAQANRATQIIQKYQIQFGYDHPIMMAGDFNSNHNFSPEFSGFLRHAKLSDTVGLKKKTDSYADRVTHSYFPNRSAVRHSQLDGILISTSLVEFLLESYVVPYKDRYGSEKYLPRSKDERKGNPSDHRPITAVIKVPGSKP